VAYTSHSVVKFQAGSKLTHLRFEVSTTGKMSMIAFSVVTSCGLASRYKCFGETYCLHLQGSYLLISA
jgi:hypothetical protein